MWLGLKVPMNFLMRKNRKLGMFWWRSELGDGHEGTSGGTMNGDRARRASVRARVESNGQPRMFVINQFVGRARAQHSL